MNVNLTNGISFVGICIGGFLLWQCSIPWNHVSHDVTKGGVTENYFITRGTPKDGLTVFSVVHLVELCPEQAPEFRVI